MKNKLIKLFSLALLVLTSLTFLFACGDDGSDGAVSGGGKPDGGDGGFHLCSYTTLQDEEEATCEMQGHKVYACECGETRTDIIQPLGHDWGEWELSDSAPDLYNAGWIERVCSRDEEHYESEIIPQLDPENTEYSVEVTDEPTLTEPGTAIYTITRHDKEFDIEADYLHPCYSTLLSLVGATNVEFSAYYAEEGEIGESFTVPGTYGDYTVISAGFREYDGLKTVTVASADTSLRCLDCTTLETVILPDGYTEIDDNAFKGCTSLSTINFPASLVKIGNSAFESCTSLTSVSLGNNVTEIGHYAFWKSGLISITLPSGITELQNSLFNGCTSLESITIPEGVTTIGAHVFSGCSSLTEIYLPSTLESIGSSVFYDCDNVAEVNFGGSLADWCRISFYNSGSTPMQSGKASFSVGEGKLFEINSYYVTGALGQPTQINHTFLIIPDEVEAIGNYQFYGFINGDEPITLIIEGDVTSIGDGAFGNCNIQHIIISKSVSSIDSYAFDGAQLEDSSEIYYGGSAAEYASSALKDITELSDCVVKYYGTDWRYNSDGNVEESTDGGTSWYLKEALSPYYSEEYPE